MLTLEDAGDPDPGSSPGPLQSAFIDFVLAKESRGDSDGGVQLSNVQITCVATIPRNQSQTSAVVGGLGGEVEWPKVESKQNIGPKPDWAKSDWTEFAQLIHLVHWPIIDRPDQSRISIPLTVPSWP